MPVLPDVALDCFALLLARNQRSRELMDEYDREVYAPALATLRERCARSGHQPHWPYDPWRSSARRRAVSFCHACGELLD